MDWELVQDIHDSEAARIKRSPIPASAAAKILLARLGHAIDMQGEHLADQLMAEMLKD